MSRILSVLSLILVVLFSSCSKQSSPVSPTNNKPRTQYVASAIDNPLNLCDSAGIIHNNLCLAVINAWTTHGDSTEQQGVTTLDAFMDSLYQANYSPGRASQLMNQFDSIYNADMYQTVMNFANSSNYTDTARYFLLRTLNCVHSGATYNILMDSLDAIEAEAIASLTVGNWSNFQTLATISIARHSAYLWNMFYPDWSIFAKMGSSEKVTGPFAILEADVLGMQAHLANGGTGGDFSPYYSPSLSDFIGNGYSRHFEDGTPAEQAGGRASLREIARLAGRLGKLPWLQ